MVCLSGSSSGACEWNSFGGERAALRIARAGLSCTGCSWRLRHAEAFPPCPTRTRGRAGHLAGDCAGGGAAALRREAVGLYRVGCDSLPRGSIRECADEGGMRFSILPPRVRVRTNDSSRIDSFRRAYCVALSTPKLCYWGAFWRESIAPPVRLYGSANSGHDLG